MTICVFSQNPKNYNLFSTSSQTVLLASAQRPMVSKPAFTKEHKVNLRLKYNDDSRDRKIAGLAILAGGIAFTTASILESGDGQFYTGETSRFIMLGSGIVFDIHGIWTICC